MDELTRALTGILIDVRGLHAQCIGPAMGIRIAAAIVATHGLDHALGLLRRRAVVQIDQRLAVHHIV